MQFDIQNYAFNVVFDPVCIYRELAKIQTDITQIGTGVWECKLPSFRVNYSIKQVENYDGKTIVPMVSTLSKQVSTYQTNGDINFEIARIKHHAYTENKDVVFFKYLKWEPIKDFDGNFKERIWIPIRYCLIDKEYKE